MRIEREVVESAPSNSNTSEAKRVGQYHSYQLELPDGTARSAKIKFTTRWANGGVQGYVRPAIMLKDGEEISVQVKRFYSSTYDDRGDSFTQDPEEEAKSSFEAYKLLKFLGFKVLPFYALATDNHGNKAIIMTDLTEGGTKEVYDEKHMRHNRVVENVIDRKVIRRKAGATIRDCLNFKEICLEMKRTELLTTAYNIKFSFPGGTEHMMVRDPKTNTGEVWVVDLGWAKRKAPSEYGEAMETESLLESYPEDEVLAVYTSLIKRFHPGQNAGTLYESFREKYKKRHELVILLYKAAVGMASYKWLGGWSGEEEWVKKRFIRTNFPKHFLRMKSFLCQDINAFEYYTGASFGVTPEVKERFIKAPQEDDLYLGMNFAELAALDLVMQNLIQIRTAVDNGENTWGCKPKVEFDNEGLPIMQFFDNYNESKGNSCIITLTNLITPQTLFEIDVELPWEEAYEAMQKGPFANPYFFPAQIKVLRRNGEVVEGFKPTDVEFIETSGFNSILYVYKGEIIYTHYNLKNNDT